MIRIPSFPAVRTLLALILFFIPLAANAADAERFVGEYAGVLSAADSGTGQELHLEVEVSEIEGGFNVAWNTTVIRANGKTKAKTYSVDFTPSPREGIYASAMRATLFGGRAALDPMTGDPYFWGRISGDTMTVFAFIIGDDGDYEMQRYDRVLVPEGLELHFTRSNYDGPIKSVNAMLERR